MEEWLRGLRDMILESLERHGLPFPVGRDVCTGWAQGLGLARGGRRVLYTSCMYQLYPYVKSVTGLLESLGAHRGGLRARVAARGGSLARFLARPSGKDVERSRTILRNIVSLLRRGGVEVGYLYEEEPYSGALLYELGFEEDFARHAGRVVDVLAGRGVEEVVTVDPHTHHVLTRVYPNYVDVPFKVRSWLELAKPTHANRMGKVTVHDSCLYARFLGMYHAYRGLLDAVGIERVEDPYVTGKETSMCCGGPIEAVAPDLSRSVAELRLRRLSALSRTIVVACPICLANLSRAAVDVEVLDLAEVLG